MIENNVDSRKKILLAFQVALLGMVTPELRGITVGWDTAMIQAVFYYDVPIGTIEEECVSDIEAEVIASFPEHDVSIQAERLAYPQDLNVHTLMAWVYRRYEWQSLE